MRDPGRSSHYLGRKWALVLALSTLTMLSGCCLFGWGFKNPWTRPERVLLTKPMLEKYKVDYHDLTKLQLFLSNPLTLERFEARFDTEDLDDHILNKTERTRKDVLIFEDEVPGKMIVLLPERKKNPDLPMVKSRLVNLNWLPMEMHVNFDYVYLNYLTFTPNAQGEFALVYNQERNTLDYGGWTYKIVAGAELCKLMVDVTNDSTGIEEEYILPGNEFR